MERRSFLKGMLALAVTPALPLPGVALPTIIGDGVHDDTDGLQALFDGKPFIVDGEALSVRSGRISGGKYRVTRTLFLKASARVSIYACTFIADHDETLLHLSGMVCIKDVHLQRNSPSPLRGAAWRREGDGGAALHLT